MRSRNDRRWFRYVKGMRRLKIDRNQHTGDFGLECPCFDDDAGKGRGRVFARFADYPKACGCYMCANPRRGAYKSERITLDEKRANDSFQQQLEELNGV